MLEYIITNFSTIIVGLAVAGLLGGVSFKLIKDKKNGKSSCGGGCANCAASGMCHTKNSIV